MTTYRQALIVSGAVVGQYVTSSSDQTPHFDYFYTDQIGSITEIADGAGALEAAYAYDPWGRRRDAVNWNSILPPSTIQSLNIPTRRGYTGGEMLDETGFVMLGARVYSPELGRWLSPDPAGMGSPYVYVSDNPESDTDPTGTMDWGQIAIIAALAAVSVMTGGITSPLLLAEIGAGEGFVAGFVGSGGNFRAGLIGAAAGAAMGEIGGGIVGSSLAPMMERASLEGFVGGALTEANGGRFSDGFLGAFAASAGGSAIDGHIMSGDHSWGAITARTATAAALGGSVSRINGGSFADGAWSAAFQHLFNDEHIADPNEDKKDAEISFSYDSKGLGKFAEANETYDVTGRFKNVFPEGRYTINVRLDASISGEDADMETLNGSTILVSPNALSRPANILASEIGHELVHVNDWLRGASYSGMSNSVEAASEVRAYDWQKNNAASFQLPPRYRIFIDQQIVHYEDIKVQPLLRP